MAHRPQRRELAPFATPTKWLQAAPLDSATTVIPEGFKVTVLPAKGYRGQTMRAKGDTTGHAHADYYHNPKARLRAAARG